MGCSTVAANSAEVLERSRSLLASLKWVLMLSQVRWASGLARHLTRALSKTPLSSKLVSAALTRAALVMGYEEAPEGLEVGNGMYYNKWMAGNQIAMPAPILDGSVDYDDGTDTNAKQLSEDVVTFLKWSAEPELEVRKNMGVKVILFFLILGTVVYLAKNRLWRGVH